MENITVLALAVLVSLAFSTIVALVITDPLRTILRQMCLEGNASAFWVSFTNVMLYITPLLFAVQFANVHSPSLVENLQTALSSSLFGGFAALLVVGYQISRARRAR
jgi:hypothetical protein